MIENSSNFKVWIDLVEVPNVTNSTLSFSASTIDVTKSATNSYRERIVSRKSGTISFDCLLDTNDLNRFSLNNRVIVRWGTINRSFTTNGYISNIDQSGGTDDVSSYSVSIETDGAISIFDPVFELQDLCDTDGTVLCDTDGEALRVNVQIN